MLQPHASKAALFTLQLILEFLFFSIFETFPKQTHLYNSSTNDSNKKWVFSILFFMKRYSAVVKLGPIKNWCHQGVILNSRLKIEIFIR